MKRFLFVSFLVFLFAFPCGAQTPGLESSLLNISRRTVQTAADFNGTPFVYIGATAGGKAAEPLSGWMDEEKKRLFGTTQITKSELLPNGRSQAVSAAQPAGGAPILKEVSYQNPFGRKKSDVYVPHTTDFVVQIHVITPDSLLIEEHISYINTQNRIFERALLLSKTAMPESFQLLAASLDGKPFSPVISREENEIILTGPDLLPAGHHFVFFKYILKDGLTVQKKKGYIHYNITGVRWPLPVAELAVYVSFLNKTDIWEKEMLFGTNYVRILNSFSAFSDRRGNTAFALNNTLPAYANAALYVSFNANVFPKNTLRDWFNSRPDTAAAVLALLFVFVYLSLSAVFLRFEKPEKNNRRYIYRFSPLSLSRLLTVFPGKNLLQQLKAFYLRENQKMPLECRLTRRFFFMRAFCSSARYFRLSLQHWITGFCLTGGAVYFARRQNIYLTFCEYTLILVLTGVMIMMFFHYAGRKRMLKETNRFKHYLLDSNLFYGLTDASAHALFMKNYPYAAALNFLPEWTAHYQTHCSGRPVLINKGE